MKHHPQEAKQFSLLLKYGIVTGEEVIAWADSQIVSSDCSAAFVELSTSDPSQLGDVIRHLNRLSEGADFWTAFRAVLPRVHAHLRAHPSEADRMNFMIRETLRTHRSLPADLAWLDPDCFEGMWPVRNPDGWIISSQGISLCRIGPDGEIWRTRRLAWDGFANVQVNDQEIIGLALGPERTGVFFRVDAKNGKADGGSFG